MEALTQKLPTCVNKDFIDEVSVFRLSDRVVSGVSRTNCVPSQAATEFLTTCNTKGNRKKLCRALFTVPRIRLP